MRREPVNVVPLSIRQHLRAALAGVIVLAGGVGGWAATTELSGAVIGSGTLVVDSYTKKVQHPTGGVVGELNVREGAKVKAGDVLVRRRDGDARQPPDRREKPRRAGGAPGLARGGARPQGAPRLSR
jgi:multidrug efflux pump subunit AcrA (membrane-fusion protein)